MAGQETGPGSPEDMAKEGEKAFCTKLLEKIHDARSLDVNKRHREVINKNRRYARGITGTDATKRTITNLIHSTIAGAIPHIYARNPKVAATAKESVEEKRLPAVKSFAETCMVLLNHYYDKARLKHRAKSMVRAAMTSNIGWTKVSFQQDLRGDPLIISRMNDLQDNIRRIDYLIECCESPEEHADHEANKAELEEQIKGIAEGSEIQIAKGLVLDILPTESVVIDPDITDFDCYLDAKWIAHYIDYDLDEYQEKFGKEPSKKATRIKLADADDSSGDKEKTDKVRVWEKWHKVSNTVYTMTEGDDEWSRPPYRPKSTGQRFYPFFGLAFNIVDGQFLPMSDVELLWELQDEYEEIRETQRKHRKTQVPHWLCSADVDPKSIERRSNAEIGEIVIVDANGQPLKDMFQPGHQVTMDPRTYDTTPVRSDVELVSGMGDAARGNVVKPKTLGEAEIMERALAGRTSERQDTIEDLLEDMSRYIVQVMIRVLSDDEVLAIAGEKAVWPDMDLDAAYEEINVEVQAGTSGKPNKAREQEQWMALVPEIQNLIVKVVELRSQGQHDIAKALVAVMKETLHRFDENIDINEFLPPEEEQNELEEAMDAQRRQEAEEIAKAREGAEIRKIHSEAELNEAQAAVAGVPEVPAPSQMIG